MKLFRALLLSVGMFTLSVLAVWTAERANTVRADSNCIDPNENIQLLRLERDDAYAIAKNASFGGYRVTAERLANYQRELQKKYGRLFQHDNGKVCAQ